MKVCWLLLGFTGIANASRSPSPETLDIGPSVSPPRATEGEGAEQEVSVDEIESAWISGRMRGPLSNNRRDMSAPSLAHFSGKMAAHMSDIAEADSANDAFTPQLTRAADRFEDTPLGRIELGAIMRSNHQAVVFDVVGRPDLAVKYMHDCDPTGSISLPVHPLILEFVIAQEAMLAGVGLNVSFLSPPTPLPLDRSDSVKLAFAMETDEEYNACLFAGGSVRYMLLERARGISLTDLKREQPSQTLPLGYAMLIGRGLVRLMENLHSRGVLHGNFHQGQVVMVRADSDSAIIKMRDYSASFFDDEIQPATSFLAPVSRIEHIKSPWELTGGPLYRYTKRDDLYRVLETVASLIIPNYHSHAVQYLAKSAPDFARWKSRGNIFSIPGVYDPLDEATASPTNVMLARRMLSQSLLLIRASQPDHPPYDEIAKLLQRIKNVLSRAPSATIAPSDADSADELSDTASPTMPPSSSQSAPDAGMPLGDITENQSSDSSSASQAVQDPSSPKSETRKRPRSPLA